MERGREGQIEVTSGTFLVAQGLRLCSPNAGGPGSIPGQGTRSHMPKLRLGTARLIKINVKKKKSDLGLRS